MISELFDKNDYFDSLNTNTNLMNFSENRLYGYYCSGKLYVPNNDFITIAKTQAVLNFADTNEAFEKLIETITNHCSFGRIPASSKFHINNIKVTRSYLNIHDLYKRHILLHINRFSNTIDSETFLTFSSFFQRFTKEIYDNIYFMSDFITSEIGTIFSTGLAIKIFDEKADDLNSAKSYIQDKFFRIFKNICLQHNFIIDKHMPWVIVYRVSDAYMRSNLSRYLDVYESDLLFFFDAIKIAYIYYVKNILSKELYSSVDISNFDLPKDCILKIYVKKKLDGHKIHYSNEDFQTMLRFFKSNTITNGLRDSAYKLNNIEQKFSTIYDDWEQVYLRPGNN